jgi:hypothetical protein
MDRFRYAIAELAVAIEYANLATAFFSEANFKSLRTWTSDPRCPIELRAGLDSAGRIVLSVPGGSQFRRTIPHFLTDPVPILPDIIERELVCSPKSRKCTF